MFFPVEIRYNGSLHILLKQKAAFRSGFTHLRNCCVDMFVIWVTACDWLVVNRTKTCDWPGGKTGIVEPVCDWLVVD